MRNLSNLYVDGVVGIGTTNPAYPLQISSTVGGGGMMSLLNTSSTESSISYRISNGATNTGWVTGNSNNDFFMWSYTLGSQVMTLKPSGNVGIGTTSPAVKLEIKTATSSDTSVEGLRVYNAGGGVGAGVRIGLGVGATYSEKGYIRTDIVSGGAGRMFFGVNGGDVITINNSNNVGIGTTSPLVALEVRGTAIITNQGGNNYNENLRLPQASSGYAALTLGGSIAASGSSAAQWTFVKYPTNNNFAIRNYDSDRLYITTGGNVLIGTTTDSGYKLDVNGNTRLNGDTTSIGYLQTYGLFYHRSNFNVLNKAANGWLTWVTRNTSEAETTINLDYVRSINGTNGGNVGIGTTNPASPLDVLGKVSINSDGTLNWGNAKDYGRLTWDTGKAIIRGESGKALSLGANGTQDYLYITTAGNVGIGTTSPSTKLEIVGTIRLHDGLDNGRILFRQDRSDVYIQENAFGLTFGAPSGMFFETDSNNNGNGLFNITRQGVSSFYIDDNRNVGIGTTSPSGKLDVRGGKTYLSPLGNWSSGIDSHALVLRNLNDTAFTADALTAYNAHTSWDIENYSTFTASPRVNDASVYTYAGENASASVAVTRFVQFNSTNTSPLLDWTFFQWDGAGTSALDLKKPSKLWTVKTYENGATVEKMSLSGDGDMYLASNLGIGETSPSTKLYIKNTAGDADITLQGSSQTMRIDQNSIRTTTASQIHIFTNNTTTNGIYISSTGNVGIGTTTPQVKLDVNGHVGIVGSNYLYFGHNTGNIGAWTTRQYSSASTHYFNAQTFIFNNEGYGAIEAMRIQASTGRVGIGTASPNTKLHIEGPSADGTPVIRVNSTAAPNAFNYAGSMMNSSLGASKNTILLIGKSEGNKNSGYIGFNHSGTDGSNNNFLTFGLFQVDNILNITGAGNVGIGTTTPSTKLDVNGVITATGGNSTNWNTAYGWGNHASAGYATQTYVNTAVANLVDSAPGTLDTLNELAAALGDDPNFATTVTNSIATKLPLAGGSLTGALTISDALNSPSDLLTLSNNTTTNGVTIKFTDQAPTPLQFGRITFYHQDTKSYGSGAAFVIGSDQSNTTILADGKLMYAEGIYSKPPSGTGAGTRKDINWDTAYSWGNHAGLYAATSHTHSATDITSGTLDSARLSGTYAISVSGNAATASKLVGSYSIGSQPGTNSLLYTGQISAGTTGLFPTVDNSNSIITLNRHSGNYDSQLGFSSNGNIYYRKFSNSTAFLTQPWLQVWHSGNFSQTAIDNWNTAYSWGDHAVQGYATTTQLADYLPLTGGTIAGALTISGNLVVNGTITENSSIKIKENVEDLNGSLEKVVNLRPVSYNKIGLQNKELGLIAEEVQNVYPEFVHYDENGDPIGVNYSRLTVALIGAVQELTKQVEELRNKING